MSQLQKTKHQDDHIYSEDYYAVLSVSADATRSDIKTAFARLANRFHPDKGGDNEKFMLIMEAYMTLINPEKRKHYDEHGRWDEEEKAQAENAIRSFVDQVLNGEHDLAHVDLIGSLRKATNKSLNDHLNHKQALTKKLDRLVKNKDRTEDELILAVFRARIGVLEGEIEGAEISIRVTNIAKILLSRCHYSFDEITQPQGFYATTPETFNWSR